MIYGIKYLCMMIEKNVHTIINFESLIKIYT